jgi:hypothetical protein
MIILVKILRRTIMSIKYINHEFFIIFFIFFVEVFNGFLFILFLSLELRLCADEIYLLKN